MRDKLDIKGLSVETRIGVHQWEQQILQRLFLDISIPADWQTCADNLGETLDYDALCQSVRNLVAAGSFQLIETVANQVAQHIKLTFSVDTVTVSVSKPHAVQQVGDIRVTVVR